MQLSDRQSSHAQASSTTTASKPVSFQKAYSPDIPEPPHKKGSGQGSSFEGHQHSEPQLRRKLPEGLGRKTPVSSPASGSSEIQQTDANGSLGDSELLNGNKSPSPLSSSSEADSDGPPKQKVPHRGSGSAFGMSWRYREQESNGNGSEQDPELRSQLHLARLLGNRGKYEGALCLAEKLYERNSQDPDVLCLRGQCYTALNKRPQVHSLCCNPLALPKVERQKVWTSACQLNLQTGL